ncbi:MAG TPA: thymidylate synthase [Candidatus Bathyarchaeia archaeon]|nr:thymidylate synthase [Candidatus Bathyarchaeia archaeon]
MDYEYHSLIEKILEEGLWKENRTGTKTLSIFGPQVTFKHIGTDFPLLTTKNIHLKSIIGELLWFLSGSTNKHVLKEKYGVSIWDEWGDDETGELGPVYGHQWVNWEYFGIEGLAHYGIDANKVREPLCDGLLYGQRHIKKSINQIQNLIDTLRNNPDDRRMIVSAWHVDQIPLMALPPCHWSFQCDTRKYPNNDRRTLNLKMNIRSWDIFLGGPFNIASYAILLLMLAHEVGMNPGDLTISAGDVHIYENHLEYIYKQLNRNSKFRPPLMNVNPYKKFWDYEPDDFTLDNYDPHPNWKNVPVAI